VALVEVVAVALVAVVAESDGGKAAVVPQAPAAARRPLRLLVRHRLQCAPP
jgi:hypothetical protein